MVAPPSFAEIAAKYARLPELKRLFEELSHRYETLEAMQVQFTEHVKRTRAVREGKPVKISKRGRQMIEEFARDAERAAQDVERLVRDRDDGFLLRSQLSSIQQMISFDEGMLSAWHADDKPLAQAIINHQRGMLKLIEEFIESSSFNGLRLGNR